MRKEKQKVVDTALCHNALCGCCSCSDKCDHFDPQVDASKEAESALIVIITFPHHILHVQLMSFSKIVDCVRHLIDQSQISHLPIIAPTN